MRAALSDLVLVELVGELAGAYCGKLFADLGADVIRLEAPSALEAGTVPAAFAFNTNKRSVRVDPADHGASAAVWTLLERADIVIESGGRGTLEAWGTSSDAVRAKFPHLVVVAISGFGIEGPYAGYRADDLVVQAVSGSLLLQGTDQQPVRLPAQLGLCFTGSMAAVAALGAVRRARASGEGSLVDCSAVEAMASMPNRATLLLSHHYRAGAPASGSVSPTGVTLIPSGVFPCADGYVAMMSTPQQLREMLDVLDDDALRLAFDRPDAFERGETKEAIDAALYPWLFEHTRAEATAAAQAAGWPLAGVNTPAEVLAADHLHQRRFWTHVDHPELGALDLPGPPYRFAEGGWNLRRLSPTSGQHTREVVEAGVRNDGPASTSGRPPGGRSGRRLPLEGVRVADLTTVWAGPYATMLLADLGAEVIRVENPWVLPPTTKGYHARPAISNLGQLGSGYGPAAPDRPDRPWNRHALNNSISRNKLSCTIDTRRPEGRELLMRLTDRSDVLIENFKSTGLTRMGIGVGEMQARNPRLLVVRMPPTGLTGDWAGYSGFGTQFDGLTGLTWICGQRHSELVTSPATTYMDAASGPAAAFATMAALAYRDATGRGQLVELAQSENVLNHLADVFVSVQLGIEPEREGNRRHGRAPQGLYPCRGDGRWLAISVADDREWEALASVIGREDLMRDERLADVAGREAAHDELDDVIAAWTRGQELYGAFHALQAAGVTAGPLLDDQGFCDDPHVRARRWMRPLTTTDVGTHDHPGHPYRGIPLAWRRGSPGLGEDNEYVYKEILGATDDEMARYREAKILAEDYLAPDGTPY
jgi:crotonobetainyl-CoA:carnitine CoA-transferase CaiB-like acyl-CoA transferase